MPRPVVHFEIAARDTAKINAFYAQVFDWKIDANNPMHYGIVSGPTEGAGIGGGIAQREADEPGVTFYIEVPDLAAALRAVEAAGGRTVMEPMEVPGMVALARFADPEGNIIGLVRDQAP